MKIGQVWERTDDYTGEKTRHVVESIETSKSSPGVFFVWMKSIQGLMLWRNGQPINDDIWSLVKDS